MSLPTYSGGPPTVAELELEAASASSSAMTDPTNQFDASSFAATVLSTKLVSWLNLMNF